MKDAVLQIMGAVNISVSRSQRAITGIVGILTLLYFAIDKSVFRKILLTFILLQYLNSS